MKVKLLLCLLIFLLAVPLMALPPKGKRVSPTATQIDNGQYINANRIMMFVTNHGNFARDLGGVFGYDYGTWFPYTSVAAVAGDINRAGKESPNYASGLWIGAVDSATSEIRICLSEYSSEYVPGPMANGTFQPDQGAYKVYHLYRDSLASNPNADYLNWPVDQGAPINEDGTPEMIGDQMMWSVFNDADPDQHSNDAGETNPLGIEIRQTIFAFDREGSLGNIVFLRMRVYNRGGNTLNDCYFSLWDDPDLGGAGDDFVGCDTTLALGYVYNSNNDDSQYGEAPPSMGYDFFQGPLIETGNEADTGRMWGELYPGYTNMGMTSFNKYINGTDPDNYDETYGFMRGLDKFGNPYVYDGNELKYVCSGDPVAGTGDLDENPADRRFMQSTGPITFRPGDSLEILAAIVVGRGASNLQSITVMKNLDDFAQKTYENGFNPPTPPARPVVRVTPLPNEVLLSWGDTSEVDPGAYEFEGYTVWQGPTAAGPWTIIATYDIPNARTNGLIDTLFDPASGLNLPVVKRAITNSGITRYFRFTRDWINGGPLNDLTTYYFRVSAFSFADSLDGQPVPNGDRFLESATLIATKPQAPPAGINLSEQGFDTIPVTHSYAGPFPSDGSVLPIVMEPRNLTGHTYRVIFKNDPSLGIVWDLEDVTAGTTLLEDQTNQSGDGDYFTKDGILVKVLGPPGGVKPGNPTDDPATPESTWGWDIPQGDRRFTWANASGFGWEAFNGALGWGGPGDTHGFGDFPPVPAPLLPNVLLKLAAVDADGNFNAADDNVSYAYRYIRDKQKPPAQPEFAAFYTEGGSTYDFQDFEPSCPLSAWNTEVDPPERLAVGYLENNAEFAVLDGKYGPRVYTDFDEGGAAAGQSNTSADGPREWLWIYLHPYSETPDPQFEGNATNDSMPVMYWATWNRRNGDPWEAGDEFAIIPNRVNNVIDTFTFTASAPVLTSTESDLDMIKAVPNPFYLYSSYDASPGSKLIQWHHLPEKCTITVYNLSGDLMRTITKNDNMATAGWDLLTENGLPVASGIYIYVVDAPGFGQKIGKMAIFTEQEVLQIY